MHQHLLLIFILCGLKLSAQSAHVPLRRTFPAVGSYSANVQDPFAATVNQAQLATIRKPAIGIYNERKFMIKDLSLLQCAFVLPHRSGGYGFHVMHTGSRFYNETGVALGFGKKLNDVLLLGIQFNYLHAKAATGVAMSTIGFEAGTLVRLAENIQAGFHIRNMFVIPAGDKKKLAVLYSFGFGYDVTENLLLTTTIEKQANLSSNLLVAMRYAFLPGVYVVAATFTAVNQVFAGFGFVWDRKELELAAGYHNQLGFTPALTLSFSFGKPVDE